MADTQKPSPFFGFTLPEITDTDRMNHLESCVPSDGYFEWWLKDKTTNTLSTFRSAIDESILREQNK